MFEVRQFFVLFIKCMHLISVQSWIYPAVSGLFNPLTPKAFAKNGFLDILVVFMLDIGQISFNLVENAFATRQLALLASSIAFYDTLARACAEMKSLNQKVTKVFRLFDFCIFYFAFSFSPFLLSLLQ